MVSRGLTLVLALALAGPALAESCLAPGERLGTTVEHWQSDVAAAGSRARSEGKLLLVLHVSGDFEQPGYT